jgi:pimeloyl-ACP methyl ester carboxylesterase
VRLPVRAAAAPLPEVPGVEHRVVRANGLRQHVALAGAGEPLVLLHGWPQHWWMWREQIPPLAERWRVICPDLRGFGWTEAPRRGYAKEALVDDVLALLDALGIAPAARIRLAGHDWGGWVGFLLCLRRPERVHRFVALGIVPPWPAAGAVRRDLWRFWYQGVLAAPGLGARLVAQPAVVRAAIRNASAHPAWWRDADLDVYARVLREPARARASVRLYRTWLTEELGPVLRGHYPPWSLAVPTLLLSGAQDAVLRPARLREAAAASERITLEIVDDCGHFLPEERSDLVTERLLAFLA